LSLPLALVISPSLVIGDNQGLGLDPAIIPGWLNARRQNP
jgi:hypothetical protein